MYSNVRSYIAAPLFEEESLPAGTQPKTATYEELRRKNREEYELKKTKQFRYVIVAYLPSPYIYDIVLIHCVSSSEYFLLDKFDVRRSYGERKFLCITTCPYIKFIQ